METGVTYKYRAPRLPLHYSDEDTVITSERMDVDVSRAMTHPHPIGEPVWLQAEDPEEFGEGVREYQVILRYPLFSQDAEHGTSLLGLDIIVTDSKW
jgi:hypothetical protein